MAILVSMRRVWLLLSVAFCLLAASSLSAASKGEVPKVGSKAPGVALRNVDGKTVKLSQYKGKKNILLAFFPKSFTPG